MVTVILCILFGYMALLLTGIILLSTPLGDK